MLKSYRSALQECRRGVDETRAWEGRVLRELRGREEGLGRAERSEFANVLVCKALEGDQALGWTGK